MRPHAEDRAFSGNNSRIEAYSRQIEQKQGINRSSRGTETNRNSLTYVRTEAFFNSEGPPYSREEQG
jgi:hypothetical protein